MRLDDFEKAMADSARGPRLLVSVAWMVLWAGVVGLIIYCVS